MKEDRTYNIIIAIWLIVLFIAFAMAFYYFNK